ncbi:SH3 domain-containing protein [Helicobacter pylori]|uniref:SH3 domain-containing protein n=1 Tax=Helicobacter pylori TaxID=210 RepID=UPI0018D16677|nr:SH3 domain-containing protein [Helicobacter pylori]MBH0282832.1 SH3 domain-containing protein [Helicobacter pylori]MBH0287668.1 SH3 domain-containing protein [Helicobacter pylori]MBH0290266.1 SH3 domain-containing protein [Helicobacter pylori]
MGFLFEKSLMSFCAHSIKILKIISLILSLLAAFLVAENAHEPEEIKAKVAYVKIPQLEDLENTPVYIGQIIGVTYDLLLFDAEFLEAKIKDGLDKTQIELLNKMPKWKKVEKELFRATYYYKIKGIRASIPSLEVSAFSNKDKYIDHSIAPKVALQVTDLSKNPRYANVMAKDLQVVQYKTKDYDDKNNILVMELAFKEATWEDFHIKEAIKQGFDNASLNQIKAKEGSVFYYCVLPKTIQSLSFDYFSLSNRQFKTLSFSAIPTQDTTGIQSDLIPKNNFLVFSNVALLALCVFFLVLFFIFGRKLIFLGLGILCLGFVLYHLLFTQKSALLLAHKKIRILPTQNSTILGLSKNEMPIKILGSHDDYYKILTPHEQIGWVKKDEVK